MTLIVVNGLEVEVEEVLAIGHRWPDGTVTTHDDALAAQAGVAWFGGEIVAQLSYRLPWFALPADSQPKWLESTE